MTKLRAISPGADRNFTVSMFAGGADQRMIGSPAPILREPNAILTVAPSANSSSPGVVQSLTLAVVLAYTLVKSSEASLKSRVEPSIITIGGRIGPARYLPYTASRVALLEFFSHFSAAYASEPTDIESVALPSLHIAGERTSRT